ncbi:MAG: SDR family oxidoreductase [Polyangiaceae bacterium]|nr:SDR family oxidoreductase [Polyangiaceae bacterium]
MSRDLEGKVFLITGGTEGIGKAAALDFARRHATLVIVGRNREKTERVVGELKAAGGYDRVDMLLGDMAKMADIRAVAKEFGAKYDRLDVLVNNAGAWFEKYALTSDGIEQTFALNHIGYFLLTTELLELIRKTPNSRVVNTSSGAHTMSRFDLKNIVKRDGSAGFPAYADSKLANVLFTLELAKRLSGSTAAANCFHPGFVRSAFGWNNEGFIKWSFGLGQTLFARSVEKGAETLIWLATHPEAAGFNGQYFYDLKVRRVRARGDDPELARRLWDLSEGLCRA